jgi:hypothetical protein
MIEFSDSAKECFSSVDFFMVESIAECNPRNFDSFQDFFARFFRLTNPCKNQIKKFQECQLAFTSPPPKTF